MRRGLLFIAVTTVCASLSFAFDYGLSLSTTPKFLYEDFSFIGSASPWFSTLIGDSGELYLSGIVDVIYEDEEWDARFDLGRFQATSQPRPGLRIDAGRFSYTDVSGFVAHGLFDGARFAYTFQRFNFLVGAFYTGFLNKEKAGIVMSAADYEDSGDDDEYFAPRRMLLSAAIAVPSLFRRLSASAEAIGQFDLRGGEDILHSQYISYGLSGPLTPLFSFTSSLAMGFAEAPGVNLSASMALRSQVFFLPPSGLADRAYLGFKWASGDSGGLDSFLPVKGLNAGTVFNANLSGIFALGGGYFTRLKDLFSAELSTSIFLRQGEGAYDAEFDFENDDTYLGSELYGEVLFFPSSELLFTLGTGAFFPNPAAFVSGAGIRPLLAASLVVSF